MRYATRTDLGKPESARGDIVAVFGLVHHTHMAEPTVRHFLRAWRKHRGLTTYAVGETVGTTHATLSRIERGLIPYNQNLLEKLAVAYDVPITDLLGTNPESPEGKIAALTGLDPASIDKVVEFAAFLKAQRGTSG